MLGERVKMERLSRGLSLRQAADEAGVMFTLLHRVEQGHDCVAASADKIRAWLGDPPSAGATKDWQAGYQAGIRAAMRAIAELDLGSD
jgi:transcriptional regulator with XRE-family HTH domain